ncbi:MAG: DUF819 domain-containing protein [Oscillospiraceae bacterium]|nr:DUF819 domain-containing protein [Oscillospiraceae bacterium]
MLFESILGHTLIAADDTWGLLGVMLVSVFAAIYLEQKYDWASKLSGCIIALLLAMFMANIGVIPTACVLYDDIVWGVIVPMALPLLLLQCNLKKVWGQAGRMLGVYLIGGVGTFVGGLLAFFLLKGAYAATGGNVQDLAAVTSMMTGSYIGGSANLAAMAATWNVAGTDVTAAAVVADNLLMALYFFALIAFAGMKFFRKHFTHPIIDEIESNTERAADQTQASAFWSRKDVSLMDIAKNLAYSVAVVWASVLVAGLFKSLFAGEGLVNQILAQFLGNQYVWITAISVAFATLKPEAAAEMHGSQEMGTFMIYMFLFVIGVPANIMTVVTKSPLFLVLCFIMVCVNMLFCFVGAKLTKCHLEDAIIASNANIGGPTTAAGMAISQGWSALIAPAMLVGVLGYIIGNYAGLIVGMICGA